MNNQRFDSWDYVATALAVVAIFVGLLAIGGLLLLAAELIWRGAA